MKKKMTMNEVLGRIGQISNEEEKFQLQKAVYGMVAPKLALALKCENQGSLMQAANIFLTQDIFESTATFKALCYVVADMETNIDHSTENKAKEQYTFICKPWEDQNNCHSDNFWRKFKDTLVKDSVIGAPVDLLLGYLTSKLNKCEVIDWMDDNNCIDAGTCCKTKQPRTCETTTTCKNFDESSAQVCRGCFSRDLNQGFCPCSFPPKAGRFMLQYTTNCKYSDP